MPFRADMPPVPVFNAAFSPIRNAVYPAIGQLLLPLTGQ